MLNPGDKVTPAEIDRIEQLSHQAKEQEIANIVSESGRIDDTGKMVFSPVSSSRGSTVCCTWRDRQLSRWERAEKDEISGGESCTGH